MSAYRSNACVRNVDNRITDNRARGLESQTVYGARVSARFYGWMVFGMQIASCDWFNVRFYTVFWNFLPDNSSVNQHTRIDQRIQYILQELKYRQLVKLWRG